MQILTFVTVILMVLTLMTYARLEVFLDFHVTKAHYAPYMELAQRTNFNKTQTENYRKENFGKRNSKIEKVTNATSKLSFSRILNKTARNNDSMGVVKQQQTIAKQLMIALYTGQNFFKPADENPELLDKLLKELIDVVDAQEKIITRLEELSNIVLPSEDTRDILYGMLQGMEKVKNPDKKSPSSEEIISAEQLAERNEILGEADVSPKEGYVSLYDFITLAPGPKVRMFLASRELLQAIFDDSSVVENVISTRHELFLQIESGKIDAGVANQQFQQAFLSKVSSGLTEDVLDFTIKVNSKAGSQAPATPTGKSKPKTKG